MTTSKIPNRLIHEKVLIYSNTLIIPLTGGLGVNKHLRKQKQKISLFSYLLGIPNVGYRNLVVIGAT